MITTGETNMIHKRTKSTQNTKTQPAKISNNENDYNIKKVYQEWNIIKNISNYYWMKEYCFIIEWNNIT